MGEFLATFLQQLEDVIRLLIDREEGNVPAWEGIRVIRERRD